MRTLIASVLTAIVASLCCWGPLVLSLAGAGALSAAATRFEPYRPYLAALALVLLGAVFYSTYRNDRESCAGDGCAPTSLRQKKWLWLAAAIVLLLLTFPYYIRYFI